tara:strand:+ start:1164 stop:1655 length:492 start_codon:yes stop_codon:yes gene_type:complete
LDGGVQGELTSPARRRQCIDLVCDKLGVSERRACRLLRQHRSTQRHAPRGREDEERLVVDMIELTCQFGRYGYRRVAALLRDAGWQVNDKRVERLWKREGLKVPMKQAKRGWLWLNPSWDIAAQCPGGQWMVPIFGSSPNVKTTSGPMTSFITVLTMAELSEH